MSHAATASAAPRAYIVTESESRYTLLGAFGRQFGVAMANRGVRVNPDPGGPVSWTGDGRAAYIFFNHLPSVEETYGWAGNLDRAGERSIVQWCVDHPLTLESAWLDRMSRDPGFRLLTVTSDDAHLLSLRFPNLKHATVWHGVDESALCNAAALESSHRSTGKDGRDIDVIIAGSIAGKPELDQYKSRVPQVLHKVCEEIIALRLAHPTMSFGQAMDVALPSGLRASDHWMMMATLFAYTTAAVGRARRVAAAQSMQGLNTILIGTDAWKEFAIGTLKYAGQVAYDELPHWLHRSKVCLALSPPQFATGFSERLLVSMAAGCATVAEERLAITREFAKGSRGISPVQQYAPDRPELARILVGKLLTNADQRIAMGAAGRTIVEQNHLWVHRVGPVFAATGMLDQTTAQRVVA